MDRQELRKLALGAGRQCGCARWGGWESLQGDELADLVSVAYLGIPGQGERAICEVCGGFVLWWSFERQASWPTPRAVDPPPREGARDGVYNRNCWSQQDNTRWVESLTPEQLRYHCGPPDDAPPE